MIVRVENQDTKTLTLEWEGSRYVIKPGKSDFVPMACAVEYFGDPFLVDSGVDKSRTDAWNRIRVRYGIYSDMDRIATHLPKIAVYKSDGERLLMLMEDPDGDNVPGLPATASLDSGTQLLLDRMEAMERETAALRDELSRRSFESAAAPVIPADGPVLPNRAAADAADITVPAELADEFDDLTIEEMTARINAAAADKAAGETHPAAANTATGDTTEDAPRVDGPRTLKRSK
jgi:hypothetical protein